MSVNILARLRAPAARQTKSDILIANYIERNLAELPFETAKSIAERVGVSQMTVGRYLRRLGYDGLEELKQEMRNGSSRSAWHIKGKFDRLQEDIRQGRLLAQLIEQQIGDLTKMYEITVSHDWQRAIEALVQADEVFVAAYQNVRGVAQYFAAQLSYARPKVQFIDGLNGTYAELLDGSGPNRLLVLADVRRFAAKARTLALEARAAGVKVLLVSDDACTWVDEASDIPIIMPGARGPLWDGAATMVAVFDLLIANVIVELGDRVNGRVDTLARLQDMFGDFED
ncbi:MurR/RpiR family transcriptional regulator [Nitratireductor soli]|uniref:MurR/RpiR family transcriptional regulator n=1 Tax=Nitratireductor soli TaxID=1670619 RepID=UPI00065DBF0A|nr:MurR/RpiR family transcriptional regulator [Nitratireductor soli]